MTLTRDVLGSLLANRSEAPALSLVERGKPVLSWSFEELQRQRRYCRERLRQAGLRRNDRVILLSRDLPQFVALFYAVLDLELCLLPLHADQDIALLETLATQYAPAALIVELGLLDRVPESIAETIGGNAWSRCSRFVLEPRRSDWLCGEPVIGVAANDDAGNAGDGNAGVDNAKQGHGVPESTPGTDSRVVFHSSGSSGRPKAVHYSRQRLGIFLYWQQLLFERFQDIPGVGTDRFPSPRINVLPLMHWGGLSFCLQALLEGRCVYLINDFDPDCLLRLLRRSGCQLLMLIPAMYRELLALIARGEMPESLQYCLTMGEAMPEGLSRRLYRDRGIRLYTAYGMSEALSGLAQGPEDWQQVPEGSCGRRRFGELRLVSADERERDVQPGIAARVADAPAPLEDGEGAPAEGELWVRNPTTDPCYSDPELLASRYRDGWYRTGDYFRRDARGYYFFLARLDAMCVHNGRNVYPQQIESVFIEHEAIESCIAAPIQTRRGSRKLAVLLVCTDTSRDRTALMNFYLARGALYAAPVFMLLCRELPFGYSGKPARARVSALLQRAYDSEFAAGDEIRNTRERFSGDVH